MSYDKMNKDIQPSNDLLKEGQQWIFSKTGWRRTTKLTDEQKQARNEKLKVNAEKGRQAQKELLEKGKQDQSETIKELMTQMKEMNQAIKQRLSEPTAKTEREPKVEAEPENRIEPEPEPATQLPELPRSQKYKNPLLNQWLRD